MTTMPAIVAVALGFILGYLSDRFNRSSETRFNQRGLIV